MTRRSSGAVLRQIHTLFTAGSSHGLSDQQLLERFVARRDEFEWSVKAVASGRPTYAAADADRAYVTREGG